MKTPEEQTPTPNSEPRPHRAGFVNIIGRPNVGKSTLTNALVGESLSVTNRKAQTTRHRIFGMVNGEDFQLIFSDTPGIIRDPHYKLHERMNDSVSTAFQDADVMLFLTEPGEPFEDDDPILQRLDRLEAPLMVGVNKADRHEQAAVQTAVERWQKRFPNAEIYPLSALEGIGVPALLERMKELLPEHPAYFPKDQWTDRPERFFVTEIIREKILRHYKQEIPYSVEVVVESFREADTIIRIGSVIYVNRASQKPILIGHQGRSIKRVGVEARQDMEAFFGKQVHLELFVKVREGWRERDRDLKQFGYEG